MSIWIDYLKKVDEVRILQREFFDKKTTAARKKIIVAMAKPAEAELDQLTFKLKKQCTEKGLL